MKDPQQDKPSGAEEAPDVTFRMGGSDPVDASDAAPPGAAAAFDGPVTDATDASGGDADESAAAPTETPSAEQSIEAQATELTHQIARELAVAGPEGWQRLEAVFSVTVAGGVMYVLYFDESGRVARNDPPDDVVELVRLQREVSAQLGDGPWWRLALRLDVTGQLEADYDYGDEPFPDDQLLVPEAYQADLQVYPRNRLPVWLAAYIGHDNRQWRSPQQAAQQSRTDREANIGPVRSEDDFPVLPVLWARWATIAAAFVAVGSEWGPRILPALGVFEGASRSGSTLYVLPGGRAVLSGGVWNAPELEAAYNDGAPMPDLYAGAPDWVANQVLNPRAARGMLSFCYWWDHGSWYRGDSPTSDRISAAVPGVWTADTVIDVVCGVISSDPTDEQRSAAANLVAAAEAGVVTRNTLTAVFTDPADDIDGALYQLSLAGLVTTVPEPIAEEHAITLVREHIRGLGIDDSRYPLDELVAERLSVGWMVFVPTRPGEIAVGRAIFYIADDGVIEQSSSSVAPSVYAEGFEQRFHQRQTSAAADFPIQ
ncbi:hypothetical protein NDR87_19675 [Nocardia sp. CDC159]|uniref:Uncharacterized protein n=1 Tax=Nocardia pulmonis TaxID=2951408 RepID=A0A9X2EDG7_9NOCA|nr:MULTISPECIES: hypothetical protein [Nocardia]MCM6776086.1 hypothetical protein [Nocardia pulmonis]MCM6788587.1 hypothetical protein [Nocardia sp. CDC159]